MLIDFPIDFYIPYFFVTITVLLSFWFKRIFLPTFVLLTAFTGVLYQNVFLLGNFLLLVFTGVVLLYEIAKRTPYSVSLIILVSIFFALFSLHYMPDFKNLLVATNVTVSENAPSFDIELQFDKAMAAIILYLVSDISVKEKCINLYSLKIIFLTLLSACVLILPAALVSGFLKFDPKFPEEIAYIWMANNFLIVCFSEEVFFRGYLQNFFKNLELESRIPYIHIVITSIIFGLVHIAGGGVYVVLSTVAGFCYGYAYEKTGRIMVAMIVHFSVTTIHFFLFTYPGLSSAIYG